MLIDLDFVGDFSFNLKIYASLFKMAIISKPTRLSNPLAVAGNFQPNPNIDRLVKFLASVNGTDKVLMVWFRVLFLT